MQNVYQYMSQHGNATLLVQEPPVQPGSFGGSPAHRPAPEIIRPFAEYPDRQGIADKHVNDTDVAIAAQPMEAARGSGSDAATSAPPPDIMVSASGARAVQRLELLDLPRAMSLRKLQVSPVKPSSPSSLLSLDAQSPPDTPPEPMQLGVAASHGMPLERATAVVNYLRSSGLMRYNRQVGTALELAIQSGYIDFDLNYLPWQGTSGQMTELARIWGGPIGGDQSGLFSAPWTPESDAQADPRAPTHLWHPPEHLDAVADAGPKGESAPPNSTAAGHAGPGPSLR